jgi:dihydrofolate reductase
MTSQASLSPADGPTILVAVAQNGVIGRQNQLPWHLRSDLQRFKQLTMGHSLIMGRKTFESIGRVLPGRQTIVLTRSPELASPGVAVAGSLAEGLALVEPGRQAFIVGGSQVFRDALPLVQRILLTRVLAEIDGDALFEGWNPLNWRLVSSAAVPAGEHDDWPTIFEVWEKPTA